MNTGVYSSENPNLSNDSITGSAFSLGESHSAKFSPDLNSSYFDIEKSYASVREKIVHEDDLVNQRLTWLITLNGLVFSALGFTLIAEAGAIKMESNQLSHDFIFALNSIRLALLISGVGSCVAALMGVIAAYRRISQERLNYYEYVSYVRGVIGNNFSLRQKVCWMPRLTGHTRTNKFGMYCGLLIPILLGFAWFVIGWTFVIVAESVFITAISVIGQTFIFSVLIVGLQQALRALEVHKRFDERILELHDLYDNRDFWE